MGDRQIQNTAMSLGRSSSPSACLGLAFKPDVDDLEIPALHVTTI